MTMKVEIEFGTFPLIATTKDREREKVQLSGIGFVYNGTRLAAFAVNDHVVIAMAESGYGLLPPAPCTQIVDAIFIFFDNMEKDQRKREYVHKVIEAHNGPNRDEIFISVPAPGIHNQRN
jgi:hypothetical protein